MVRLHGGNTDGKEYDVLFYDFPTVVRARSQEIAREVELRQVRAIRPPRRPGRIPRSLVRATGRLGTLLVTVGHRLECYAHQITSRSDGLPAAG